MNNFKRLNELVAEKKTKINEIYKNLNSDTIKEALKICALNGSNSERIALARRIVDLKVDPLENELKRLGRNEAEILNTKRAMYEFVRKFYEQSHAELIKMAKDEQILDKFYIALLDGMHEIGLLLNAWQVRWEEQILDTTNAEFKQRFKTLDEALEFIDKNELFQLDEDGRRADRTYGAVVKTGEKFEFAAYAVAFKSDVAKIKEAFEKMIKELRNFSQNDEYEAYINYFDALKNAFCQSDNSRVIPAWQAAEVAWMSVKSELQPGHPLEYYEDAYTHAVALEWDIRLAGASDVDGDKFKQNIIASYEKICQNIGVKNERMNAQVCKNVNRTQLYISVPMIYYGAELNGLFSAQVVPNDESVSARCGKKIFAFIEHVYASAKAKPFMRLSGEIFSQEFLDFGREILFLKPKTWKKVYEISTIGHEFGHILFIDKDTETMMNKGGLFKFIEEYKATTGGLVNFFLHEASEYKMAVFHDLIARAVGLIAWMKVDEVRAYYCEGLIHLSLLFECGVLEFDNGILSVDFTQTGYEKFKEICLKNYESLARHYSDKKEAGEFLSKFCEPNGTTYLPQNAKAKAFVRHYYARYEDIGNEVDESGEWAKWQQRASEL
ncbi:invasion protein CiaB [Campylobacter suis]|uniref:DUF7897 domain-containing protein n=1 Tax=Campylobacter suis TaxID=2790657 RepID=A0ABM8Q7T4_9BACT|nr:invasion protein CiaB [Campylobacter suis]CAD7288835.1 hypothetical protein LMG8286_01544 [Campylobacter suis]